MSDIDSVSIVALVVATIALLVAAGQFLQQIYGTADGYRRCQPSVMGEWSTRTRLSWRWPQFRFETKFATPHFSVVLSALSVASNEVDMTDRYGLRHWLINNTDKTRLKTMSPKTNKNVDRPDVVSWASLLNQLHNTQELYLSRINRHVHVTEGGPEQETLHSYKAHNSILSPAIRPREWSWDLMPPDLVRPLATCDMRTIIILAHHMGMVWRTLRPNDGVMIAEGNGQSLPGTRARGLGMVLQYTFEVGFAGNSFEEVIASLHVPSSDAIHMSFGIIPAGKLISLGRSGIPTRKPTPLDRSNIHVAGDDPKECYSMSMITSALQRFGFSDETVNTICKNVSDVHTDQQLTGFSDVLGLWCDFMPLKASSITTIIHPFRKRLSSPFEAREGRLIWRHILQGTSHLTSQQTWVLGELNFYADNFWTAFSSTFSLRGNKLKDVPLVTRLRSTHNSSTEFFNTACGKYGHSFYLDLVRSHISVAAMSMDEYEERKTQVTMQDASFVPGTRSQSLSERAFIYVDNIPKIQLEMKLSNPSLEGPIVEDAWWTMMLRAVVWYMSTHRLLNDEVPPVPSYYSSSQTPVYIS